MERTEVSLTSPIGLVAGNGSLPIEFVRQAKEKGLEVVVVAHLGESEAALAGLSSKVLWIKVGQLGKAMSFLQKHAVKQMAFAGGIRRPKLFSGNFSLDSRAIKVIARAKSIRDDIILREIAAEFEQAGIAVIAPSALLDKCLPAEGVLTSRFPNSEERRDIELGWRVAKDLGSHDVGQGVCVVDGVVVALEAIEGTDAMIARAMQLAGRAGVVVKVSKPQQDLRLDLPTIGPKTIEALVAAKASALAIEAGKTIILDPQETIMAANRAAITILAI